MTNQPWNPVIYGHRGARGLAPENTMPGFAIADHFGLPANELDVHLTRDGHVVVIHDHTVDRTTDGTGRVEEMTLAELKTLNAAVEWPKHGFVPIPTLDEVLTKYGRRFIWQIEMKVDDRTDVEALIPATMDVIRRHGDLQDYYLTSFSADAVEMTRTLAPDIERGIISGSVGMGTVDTGIRLDCGMICLNEKLLEPDVVAAVRETRMNLCGWQGNTPTELERQKAARVDGFSSDRPGDALEWLRD
jgi:glycerophosphoryl diester phosphodiesterase